MGGYTLDERARRWALARRLMDDEGVEGLIVYGPTAYFTGAQDPEGTIVFLPRHGEPTALVVEPTSATWMTTKVDSNAYGVADLLTRHRLHRSELGVVGLESFPALHGGALVPYPLWRDVTARLPHAKFRSVWPALLRLIAPQHGEERAALSRSAAIGTEAVLAVLDAARPGVSAATLKAAALSVAVSHDASATIRLSVTPGLIQAEISCVYGSRETLHPAAIAVGPADPGVEQAAKLARSAYEEGLEALRPGVAIGAVRTAIRGLNPRSVVAGGRRAPIGYDLIVEPGMTFVLQPAFDGVELGGTVIVEEDGGTELTPLTADLLHARSH